MFFKLLKEAFKVRYDQKFYLQFSSFWSFVSELVFTWFLVNANSLNA